MSTKKTNQWSLNTVGKYSWDKKTVEKFDKINQNELVISSCLEKSCERNYTPSDRCNDLALFDKTNDSIALCFHRTLASSFYHFSRK
jgi:hypothetical protein